MIIDVRRGTRFAVSLGMITALGFGAWGCASKPVKKVELIPTELPREYIQKFDVKDEGSTSSPPSGPAVTQVVELKTTPSKNSKKQKKKKGSNHSEGSQISDASGSFSIPDRRPSKDPLWIGEKLSYEVTYFGMAAADVSVELLPFKEVFGRKVYHLMGHAQSSSVFKLFYNLDDSIESFMDYQGLFSYRFHLVLNETKQSRDALELYDQEKHQTYYWNRWNHVDRGFSESKEYGEILPWAQDSLSALFYLRTLPLSTGAVLTFPIASEGKVWELQVTVVRRELMETPLGRIQTVVVKPETKFRGVLEKKGDSFLWFTDDDRHLLVRMEAKVKIGTVVGRLKKVESLGTPPSKL